MLVHYLTSGGISVPMEVSAHTVPRDELLTYAYNPSKRCMWCTHGAGCPQFDQRPCCPPKLPSFDKLKLRSYLNVFILNLSLEDYLSCYPKIDRSPMRMYLAMGNTHKATRNALKRAVDALILDGEQGFKVGGCSGCKFKVTGKCKDFRPALEGTGVDVCKLYECLTGKELDWLQNHVMPKSMTAIGGIYTDRIIAEEDVLNVFTRNKP